ncbi:ROK family transcriptional regulator [Pseudogemmobacter faecipullorum]|uniref:ROK family transcriptional regulator n=1 Tax=Pseudogemmobacter faecipullorum TaxID=2755041 RepID=A0ABS8CNY3_9RHOB|nr:ROK family transcriptional regulator [Pseudogemmobacter faecipullorum]MCB5410910.1 ROK family transcriptional regulator [Pseudogemmobacter faecipullorum]
MSGKGSNSARLRQYNERVILQSLRHQREASKSDLARIAHLTPAAVADIIDGLEQAGFVRQLGKRLGRRGSPSVLYAVNPTRLYSIGIRIGRRATEAVMLDFTGEICARIGQDYDFPDPVRVRRAGNAAIQEFCARVSRVPGATVAGLGIAAPYFLGSWSETLGFPEDLGSRWQSIDLMTFFDSGEMPVFVENDATAAAHAELVLGAGMRFRDFMHISIDTFIGGGLVLDGRVHTGPHGNSAALGPLPVSPSGLSTAAVPSAHRTSLMHRASVYVLLDHLQAQGLKISRVRGLDPLPDAARQPVRDWCLDCAGALAEAILAITSVIDLRAIIIDSILPRNLHLELLALVQARFSATAAEGIVAPELMGGGFGALASPVGAATLPVSALLAPDSSVLMLGERSDALAGRLS